MSTKISLKLARTLVTSLDDLWMTFISTAEREFTSKQYASRDSAQKALDEARLKVEKMTSDITELKFSLRGKIGKVNATAGINDLTLALAKEEQLQATNFTKKSYHTVKIITSTPVTGPTFPETLVVPAVSGTKQKLKVNAIKDAINGMNANLTVELSEGEVRSISELLDVQL